MIPEEAVRPSVPVDVVLLVDGVDGQNHLCHVELGHVFWESILKLAEQSQQVPAHIVVHYQVLQDTQVNMFKQQLQV